MAYQLSRWEHNCELDVSTVNLLFERQKTSMRSFLCNRFSSSSDVLGSVAKGIHQLSVEGMDPDPSGCKWAGRMIVENAETLDVLDLGFTTRIARDFALNRRPPHDLMTILLAMAVTEALHKSDQEPLLTLSLRKLYLCGLDLGSFIRGEMALDIEFNNITELRLESCPGLSQAFPLLTGQGDPSKATLGALRDLFVRFEDGDPNFSTSFENFLTSLPGLNHLQVLIDNCFTVQKLEPILQVHGKTLTTLIWDERSGPRKSLKVSTSMFSTKLQNLRIVSNHCPHLNVLGLPLDWESISNSAELHISVIPPPTFTL